MLNTRNLIFTILFLFSGNICSAQDIPKVTDSIVSSNIDSLIADTLLKEFILNHKPLTQAQLNIFSKPQGSSVYGSFIAPYIFQNEFYRVDLPAVGPANKLKNRLNQDWIFYVFALMFFILAYANTFFPSFVTKLIRAIINPSFLSSQSREQVFQSALLSISLNFIFYFSGAIFLYFLNNNSKLLFELKWWQFISSVFLFLFIFYGVKYIFLIFLGWISNLKATINNYIFIVSLVNKIAGILMLVSSLLFVFSAPTFGTVISTITLYGLVFLLALRLIRGYQIFNKTAKMGILGYLLLFISIELLPTLVVIKWIRTDLVSRVVDFF